jgi:hypothetical protein
LARSLKGRLEIPDRGARTRGLDRLRDPILRGGSFSTIKDDSPIPVNGHDLGRIDLGADPHILAQPEPFQICSPLAGAEHPVHISFTLLV